MSSMRSMPRPSLRPQARPLLPALSAALVAALALPFAAAPGSAAAQSATSTPQPQPMEGGPGTGDPGQGRDVVKLQLGTRDLALVDVFRIGPTPVPWGTSAAVPASAAAFRQNGACGFRFAYRTRNLGTAATAGTSNRVHRDTQAGPLLATSALGPLGPGMQATSSGHVVLKPGTWLLYVRADATGQIAETDEANNLRRVKVTVTGSCAG